MSPSISQRPYRLPRGSNFMAQTWGIPQPPPGEIDMEDYRANSLNQPPRFREVLKTGKVIVGTALGIASREVAKVVAALPFDWVFIDGEHTPMGPDLLVELIKTINFYSEGRMAAVVRLPTHGHEWIAWALDAGAAGIILPHTDTAEQARQAVNAARFSPHGDRSFPPFATYPGFTDGTPEGKTMLDVWSENAAIIMQIESPEGAKNAEEIAAVPGVDAIMIGFGDLRLSMRLPLSFDGKEPEFVDAVRMIETAAKRNNLPLMGFALAAPSIEAKIRQGYTVLMVTADMLALVVGQAQNLKVAREVVASLKAPEKKAVKGEEVVTNGN